MDELLDEIQACIKKSVADSARVTQSLSAMAAQLAKIADALVGGLRSGGKVMTMGNGGSAADALHMAEELLGRFDTDRRPLPAVSLVADSTLLTCIANDYGYDEVFARQVEGLGVSGDMLVIFSTSGNGEGLRRAVERARENQVITFGLIGKGGGLIADLCDYAVVVESNSTARVQEAHTLILHLLLEHIDRCFVADD